MKRIFLLLAFAALAFTVQAQQNPGATSDPFAIWADERYAAAKPAESAMSPAEAQVFYYLNLARANGPAFAKTWLVKYYGNLGQSPDSSGQRLQRQLLGAQPLAMLKADDELHDFAKYEAGLAASYGRRLPDSLAAALYQRRLNWPASMAEMEMQAPDDGLRAAVGLLLNAEYAFALLSPAATRGAIVLSPLRENSKLVLLTGKVL